MHGVRSSILTLMLGVGAASVGAGQANRHPDRRFVDQSIPVTATVRLSGPRSGTALALSNTIVSIGREDGPEELMFGEIASAAGNSRGQVIVVDKRTEDVRLFDAQGKFLKRLGRKGQGPGEFRAPHSLLVTANDEIWIADMQRRLTVFAPSADGYTLARTIPVDIGIRSMCMLSNELIVNGVALGDPHVIRVLDSHARPIRSFGTLYSSPNALLNLQFAEGKVACDSANDLIVYASSALVGEIRTYRRDGRPVWRVVVEELRSNIITDEASGISVQRSPNGAHSLVSLTVVPRTGIVVQYGLLTSEQMKAKELPTDIQTIIIDPRTGAAALSPSALPRLGAISGSRGIALFEDPAPRLEIRELRRP
jgi:hypothetical protein